MKGSQEFLCSVPRSPFVTAEIPTLPDAFHIIVHTVPVHTLPLRLGPHQPAQGHCRARAGDGHEAGESGKLEP